MTYDETASLMKDAAFLGRVTVACLNYAGYISDEAPSVAAHNTRYRWAQQVFAAPDQQANAVMPVVVGDAQVQTDGSAITDANLQIAVETAVNKVL